MKIVLFNSNLVFRKSSARRITEEYSITLGWNDLSRAESSTTVSVKRVGDEYPNMLSYMSDGFNKILISPKTNVKYQYILCNSEGYSYLSSGSWSYDEVTLDLNTLLSQDSRFAIIRFIIRYSPGGSDQNVTQMSNDMEDWLDITLMEA